MQQTNIINIIHILYNLQNVNYMGIYSTFRNDKILMYFKIQIGDEHQ